MTNYIVALAATNTDITSRLLSMAKTLGGILIAILAFGLLIFIHELGHFIAAKRSNVKVNEFSIGMGPALLKFGKGETQYSLRAIPFGGFVAMEGEEEESEDSRSFQNASIPRQALIMISGAAMNLLLGVLILFLLSALTPRFGTTTIAEFSDNAASNQWLEVGDEIYRVNGKRTRTFNDVVYQFMRDQDGFMTVEVMRDGTLEDFPVKFDVVEIQEGYYITNIDFKFASEARTFQGILRETGGRFKQVTKMVWSSLFDLVTGRISINHLSGPVGITKEIGSIASSGQWKSVLEFVALISINLGIMNLLPFPALDGGRLLFIIIEVIRGKKMNPKVELYINGIGLLLLLLLMLVVTFKDIVKLF